MKLSEYIKGGRGRARELAVALGIKDPANAALIYQWSSGVRVVPAERCPAIERATGGAVRCEELRPDVDWSALRTAA